MHEQISDVDRGWLAGLYEGEGSGGFYGRGMALYIGMTDRDVLMKVQALFPSPQGVRVRQRHENYKPLYEWRLRRREDIAEFLRLILPLLGERRSEQGHRLLSRAEDPRHGYGSGHRNKTHCRNGHPYSDENTSRNAEGHRSCKTCRRTQSREHKRRKAREAVQ